MRATVAKPSAATVAFAVVALLSLLGSTWAYHPNLPYYGAGRRIAMSSIRTLTFYAGERTAYRRTEPLPQLKCVGSACSRYQPDVVQCQSMGDGQWKCAADLATTLRLGRVEVSCEGYDYADDPYVLKDSCALTYTLLPAKTGPDDPWRTYRPKAASSMVDLLFKLVFWGILATIAYGFWQSVRGRPHAPGASTGGRGGSGGGGGGGGGWWPGGGFFPNNGPPPPYTPKSEPDSGSSSWRPGFWTGLGLGGLAAATAASRRRPTAHAQPTYFDEGPYGFRSPVAGPSTNRRGWESRSDSHDWHQSTGFGGTRNR